MHTTTDLNLQLQAILADPDDNGARLAFADLLEEEGEQERAEFIRVQLELTRLIPLALESAPISIARAQLAVLSIRADVLIHENRGWVKPLGYVWIDQSKPADELHLGGKGGTLFVVRRGFVESITCTAADFLRHADTLFALHPITEVRLTTWPDVKTLDDRDMNYHDVLVTLQGITQATLMRSEEWPYDGPVIERLLRAEFPCVRTWHLPGDTSG